MTNTAGQTPWRAPLIQVHQAVLLSAKGTLMPPISGVLRQGTRLSIGVEAPETWHIFRQALLGRQQPRRGWVREAVGLRVQSDTNLYEHALLSKNASEWLCSVKGGWVWLNGRRRSPHGILDMLGMSARIARRPWHLLTPSQRRKVISLQLICSSARLVLIERMLAWKEPHIAKTLAMRWGEFPGAVLAIGARQGMPGPCNGRIECLSDRVVWHEGSA